MERGDFQNELTRLETELKISRGRGKLIIFVVNEPHMRDLVLDFINGKFKTKKITVTKVEQISRAVKERDSHFDVLLWQLPETVNPEVLNALNLKRELFYETDFPNVFICNERVLDDIIRDAPDFWRYRSSSHVLEKSIPAMQNIFNLGYESHFEGEDLRKQLEINDYLLKESKRDDQKAYLLSQRAKFSAALREYDEALSYYSKSLEMSERIGDYRSSAEVHLQIGMVHQRRGEYDEALTYYSRSLKLFEKFGDSIGIARTYHQMGMIHQNKGEYDEALTYYSRSLKLEEKLGDLSGIAATYGQIGNIHYSRGEYDEALTYYSRSLKLFEKFGDSIGIARTYHQMGMIHQNKGEYDEALTYYSRSLKLEEKLGDLSGIAATYGQIGNVYIVGKDYREALRFFILAHQIFKFLHSPFVNLVKTKMSRIEIELGEKEFQRLLKEVRKDIQSVEVVS